MEIPSFTPDVNETGTATAPEGALPENFLETTIPLEGTETPQAPREKPKTGWHEESQTRHRRGKELANENSNHKTSDHIHYYKLEDNLRKVSIGRCTGCGGVKEFKNHIEDILEYTPRV